MLTKHNFNIVRGVEFSDKTILVNSLSGKYNFPLDGVSIVIRDGLTDEPILDIPCTVTPVADSNGVNWNCAVSFTITAEQTVLLPLTKYEGYTAIGAKYWYKVVYPTGQEKKLGGGQIFVTES